jgi:hypothetical protein
MHVSYSALTEWSKCAFKFKLKYIDKAPREPGTVHTAYGNAVHSTIKTLLEKGLKDNPSEPEREFSKILFKKRFKEELLAIPKQQRILFTKYKRLQRVMLKHMSVHGADLCIESIIKLYKRFPNLQIISLGKGISILYQLPFDYK